METGTDTPEAARPQAGATGASQSTADVRRTTCCIVGGGPAGMILAALLTRKKVPVVLLEEHGDFDRDFRGDTVHPSTLEILDHLGWADDLLKIPHGKVSTVSLHMPTENLVMADLSRLPTKFPYIALIPQSEFLDFIHAKLKDSPDFHLELRAHVHELVRDGGRPDGAVRGVRYRDASGGWREIHADLVVAADGRFSRMRQLSGQELIKTAPPMDVLWFRLPRRPGDPAEMPLFGVGPGHLLVTLSRVNDYQLGYVIPKGTFATQKAEGLEKLRGDVAKIQPGFADRMDTLTEWKQIAVLSVESSRLERWWIDGMLMIGDAAHVMSPVGGVGINYAVQDAVVAANLLAAPLREHRLESRHLAAVQAAREFPVKVIQKFQGIVQERVLGSVLAAKGEVPAVPWQLRLISRIPILGQIPARLVAFGIRRVRVED